MGQLVDCHVSCANSLKEQTYCYQVTRVLRRLILCGCVLGHAVESRLSVFLCVCLLNLTAPFPFPVCLSYRLSLASDCVVPSVSPPSVHPSICLSVCSPVFEWPSNCQFVRPSVCLSVCLSAPYPDHSLPLCFSDLEVSAIEEDTSTVGEVRWELLSPQGVEDMLQLVHFLFSKVRNYPAQIFFYCFTGLSMTCVRQITRARPKHFTVLLVIFHPGLTDRITWYLREPHGINYLKSYSKDECVFLWSRGI